MITGISDLRFEISDPDLRGFGGRRFRRLNRQPLLVSRKIILGPLDTAPQRGNVRALDLQRVVGRLHFRNQIGRGFEDRFEFDDFVVHMFCLGLEPKAQSPKPIDQAKVSRVPGVVRLVISPHSPWRLSLLSKL
jgi:hypothetical protein